MTFEDKANQSTILQISSEVTFLHTAPKVLLGLACQHMPENFGTETQSIIKFAHVANDDN